MGEAADAAARAKEEAASFDAGKANQATLETTTEFAAAAAAAKGEVAAAAAAAAAQAKDAKAKKTQKTKVVGGSKRGTDIAKQQAHADDLPQDLEDWELSEWGPPGRVHSFGQQGPLGRIPGG